MSALRCNLDAHCRRQLEEKTLSETLSEVRVPLTLRMSDEILFELNYWPLVQLIPSIAMMCNDHPLGLLRVSQPQHFLEHLKVDSLKDEVVKHVAERLQTKLQRRDMRIETSNGQHHLQTDSLLQLWESQGSGSIVRVNVVVSEAAKTLLYRAWSVFLHALRCEFWQE